MQVKTQQLQLDMEKQTGSKLGKEHLKAVYCHSNIFNLYAEYIMQNAGLDEAQMESRLLREVSIASDMQKIPPLRQKVKKN